MKHTCIYINQKCIVDHMSLDTTTLAEQLGVAETVPGLREIKGANKSMFKPHTPVFRK